MKATTLLEKQHRTVESIFKKLEAGKSAPAPLLERLSAALAAHMAIEQEIFYPAVRRVDEHLVLEAFEEHSLAELALKRLLATDPGHASFSARVTACRELIEHHVEEEETELFPKVEKKLGDAKLMELGKVMKARFDEVEAAGFKASVPAGYAKTSADVSKPTIVSAEEDPKPVKAKATSRAKAREARAGT
jgi:iron-sulfur cluster repair protein YtfE (RIC family)